MLLQLPQMGDFLAIADNEDRRRSPNTAPVLVLGIGDHPEDSLGEAVFLEADEVFGE